MDSPRLAPHGRPSPPAHHCKATFCSLQKTSVTPSVLAHDSSPGRPLGRVPAKVPKAPHPSRPRSEACKHQPPLPQRQKPQVHPSPVDVTRVCPHRPAARELPPQHWPRTRCTRLPPRHSHLTVLPAPPDTHASAPRGHHTHHWHTRSSTPLHAHTLSVSHTLPHTCSHSHTLSHTLLHTRSHSHTLTLNHVCSHTPTHPLSHSPCTCTHTPNTVTHSFSVTHAHTCCHSHSHTLTHSQSHKDTLTLGITHSNTCLLSSTLPLPAPPTHYSVSHSHMLPLKHTPSYTLLYSHTLSVSHSYILIVTHSPPTQSHSHHHTHLLSSTLTHSYRHPLTLTHPISDHVSQPGGPRTQRGSRATCRTCTPAGPTGTWGGPAVQPPTTATEQASRESESHDVLHSQCAGKLCSHERLCGLSCVQ